MDECYLVFGGSGDIGSSIVELLIPSDVVVFSSYARHPRSYPDRNVKQFKYISTEGIPQDVLTEIRRYKIKALFYSIGISSSKKSVVKSGLSEWLNLFQTNTLTFIEIFQELYNDLVRSQSHIVALSSVAAQNNSPNNCPYTLSKAGLEIIISCLIKEEGHNKLKFSVVAPGLVDSNMARRIAKIKGYEDYNFYVSEVLNNKILDCQYVAKQCIEVLNRPYDANSFYIDI